MKITEHAQRRMRERTGIGKGSVDRIAQKALDEGLHHSETTGNLNKWITSLYFRYQTANNIRLYGDKAYMFNGETLITILQIPASLMKNIGKDKARKEQ